MAQITWRNVDAPDFRGTLDSIRTFGALLGGSTDGLSKALGNFQAADQAALGNQVLQRALQVNDPAAFQTGLQNGSILGGADLSRLSPDTLTALGARQNDLVRQAGQQVTTAQNRYNFNRQVDGDTRLAAADVAVRALDAAARSGDPRALAQAQANPALQGLRTDQFLDLSKGALTTQGNALGNQGRMISNSTGSYNLSKAMADDAARNEATDAVLRARQGAVTERQAQENLGNMYDGLSAGAKRLVGSQLGLGFGGGEAGVGAVSAPGTAGTRQGNSYDVTYKFSPTSRPVTSMSIGDVTRMQSSMIKDLGGSPVGRYQFTQATLEDYGPKVLGENWKDQPLSPENQEKIAEAIYNDRKGGDLTKTWAALTNKTAGAYKDIPWSQARLEIAQGEVGARDGGVDLRTRQEAQGFADIASTSVQNRSAQENTNSLANTFEEAIKDKRSTADILNSATAKGGPFEGADPRWVALQVERAQSYGRASGVEVPPAVALQALAQSAGSGRTSWLGQTWDALGSSITGNARDNDPKTMRGINADRVKQLIQEEYVKGRTGERVASTNIREAAAERIQAAQAAYSDAVAELVAAEARAPTNAAIRATLPRLRERAQLAQARQNALMQELTDPESALAQQVAPKKTGTVNQTSPASKPAVDYNSVVTIPVINPTAAELRWLD